jgi:hypothetical protein
MISSTSSTTLVLGWGKCLRASGDYMHLRRVPSANPRVVYVYTIVTRFSASQSFFLCFLQLLFIYLFIILNAVEPMDFANRCTTSTKKWFSYTLLIQQACIIILSILFNPLNAELNPICNLLALFGAHPIFHANRIWVKPITAYFLWSFSFH